MFCADWALGLGLWFGLSKVYPPLTTTSDFTLLLPAAIATGVATSLLLHPFDFVRGAFAAPGTSLWQRLPLSTTAFTTVAFGGYWTMRRRDDPLHRMGWAGAAGFGGAMVEVPLDRAKLAMSGGSVARAGLLALTRVPLGAMLLFAVDEALIRGIRMERDVSGGGGGDEIQTDFDG